MALPARDSELIQIMDAELARVTHISGSWLACRPGCTQCCHGAFTINTLDTARLRAGMESLRQTNPALAIRIETSAQSWLAEYGPSFPGDASTGILGTSESDQAAFEDFANDAPCPALNPATGLCDVYEFRPMTCRVFGPPVRMANHGDIGADDAEPLGHCELCFTTATPEEVAACEMPIPHALEEKLLEEIGSKEETIVAFALIR